MSIRVYSEINLHITWHTKDNLRLITPEMQPDLYAFLKNKIVQTNEGETLLTLKQLTPVRLIKNKFFTKVADAEKFMARLVGLVSNGAE